MMFYVIHVLYNIVLLLFLPIYTLFSLFQSIFKPAYFFPFLARLGIWGKRYPIAPHGIWIHAVSVGEVAASVSIIREIKEQQSAVSISLTCTTLTGFRMARRALGEEFPVVFAPLDLPFVLKIFFKRIKPRVLAVAELEIWPNYFRAAFVRKIPLVIFNGRMPLADMKGYKRLSGYFTRIMSSVSLVGVQTEVDRERYLQIGAVTEKTRIIGNIKFDFKPSTGKGSFHTDCGLTGNERVLTIGSTHRGEEVLLMPVLRRIADIFPELKIVLVPRHPHRAGEVQRLVKGYNFSPLLRSQAEGSVSDFIIVDTIGELVDVYKLSEIVIMGGSFNKKVQGHNPLEAVYFKKPLIMGPYMENFHHIRQLLLEGAGAVDVQEAEELYGLLERWLKSPKEALQVGEDGFRIMQENKGASARYAALILDAMGGNLL